MLENIRIANLPSYAKVFVGLFTTLMLFVCAWAILILYVDKGLVSESQIPAYVTEPYGEADTSAESIRENENVEAQSDFEENVKLAHTHINGQTLLFFAMGLVFLFTSVKSRAKKLVFWLFAVSVLVHNIGLTVENYHWVYEELIMLSGILILGCISYMALIIYADLFRNPDKSGQAG